MKLAIVAGGWHWPQHFYETAAFTFPGADLFVVAHRSPELPIVWEEKEEVLEKAVGPLADLDRILYRNFPTVEFLRQMGWKYAEAPNTVGDWGFFNQWLEKNDYGKYDVILNCHDDNYIRRSDGFIRVLEEEDWSVLGNADCPNSSSTYVRGSFEFWRSEVIRDMGGRFDLGNIAFTREGLIDTPKDFDALVPWNWTGNRTQEWLAKKGHRVKYLSPYYRVSSYVIEGERGLLSSVIGASLAVEEGLRVFPL